MCVVPVLLSHKDNSEKQVLVYAMLDECSTGCFITESLLFNEFEEVRKEEREMSACTLNGMKSMKAYASKNFIAKSLSGDAFDEVKLPTLYGRPQLPLDEADNPSKKYIQSWKYLHKVADSLLEDTATFHWVC